jgi:hypothetical protein
MYIEDFATEAPPKLAKSQPQIMGAGAENGTRGDWGGRQIQHLQNFMKDIGTKPWGIGEVIHPDVQCGLNLTDVFCPVNK